MTFQLRPLRFEFLAKQSVHFPPGKAANIVRSALGVTLRQISCVPECQDSKVCPLLGDCIYAKLFEPTGDGSGPSGLIDRPRPFAIRASHLDARTIPADETFLLAVNLFDLDPLGPLHLIRAFARLAQNGLGPRHGTVELLRAWIADEHGDCGQILFADGRMQQNEQLEVLSLPLDNSNVQVRKVRVEFVTPTELKGVGMVVRQVPPFRLLVARIRDRISNLRMLYGGGALTIDFGQFGEQAKQISVHESSLRTAAASRLSMRSGQTHPLGGFVGSVTYAGDLTQFVPYLLAAKWTGVGKHTVWGNGEINVEILD